MNDVNLFDGDNTADGEVTIMNTSKYNFRCDGKLVAPGETVNASAGEADKWLDRGFATVVVSGSE